MSSTFSRIIKKYSLWVDTLKSMWASEEYKSEYKERLQRINRYIEILMDENAKVTDILAKSRYRSQTSETDKEFSLVYQDVHHLKMELYQLKENRYRLEKILDKK